MAAPIFAGGLLLTGVSVLVLFIARRSVVTYRRALRSNGITFTPILGAQVLIIGSRSVVMAFGLILITSSHMRQTQLKIGWLEG